MKVFLSWSKPRSQEVAAALRDWLPDVIQSCEPWMSAEDIEAGQRWSAELEGQLDASVIGIICVTPDNQTEPWLNFEAGAISKKIGADRLNRVAPYLLGMKKEDLRQPLGQFQAKIADSAGTFELLQMINRAQAKPLQDQKLKAAFDRWWPQLQTTLEAIKAKNHAPPPKRDTAEKIDELLELARTTARRLDEQQSAIRSLPVYSPRIVSSSQLSELFGEPAPLDESKFTGTDFSSIQNFGKLSETLKNERENQSPTKMRMRTARKGSKE